MKRSSKNLTKKKFIIFQHGQRCLTKKKNITTGHNLLNKKIKKKINIVFTGNVGEAQNFDNIFKVARDLKNENINWTIIGTGRKLEEIKLKVNTENIKNFTFKGHVPLSK